MSLPNTIKELEAQLNAAREQLHEETRKKQEERWRWIQTEAPVFVQVVKNTTLFHLDIGKVRVYREFKENDEDTYTRSEGMEYYYSAKMRQLVGAASGGTHLVFGDSKFVPAAWAEHVTGWCGDAKTSPKTEAALEQFFRYE